jgi:hypothetical protein
MMFEQMFHPGDEYYDIEAAIRTGDIAYARERLSEIMKVETNAEICYLAALVAPTPTQRVQLLEKVLALDPQHQRAQQALTAAHQSQQTPSPRPSLLGHIQRILRRPTMN